MINGHLLLGGGVDIGDNVANSARFRASGSASMTRTSGGTVTSNQIFTISAWVKRGALGAYQHICSAGSGVSNFGLRFSTTDNIGIFCPNSGATLNLVTTQVFRDTGAWYHLVFAVDTTQASAAARQRLYVNGVEVTAFTTGANFAINSTAAIWNAASTAHYIGTFTDLSLYYDGYVADFINVDGQQLTPSSFGRTSADTGAWVHKNPSGLTYGTNGFRLQFNSVSVASDFGTDTSGNSNTFTVTNLSATAGVTYDWMSDTPTNGYAVLNRLIKSTSGDPGIASANLSSAINTAGSAAAVSTIGVSSGKWYWEVFVSNITTAFAYDGAVGITTNSNDSTVTTSSQLLYVDDGNKWNGSAGSAYGATYTTNDTIGVALDCDSGTLTFYKNNTSQGVAISSGITGNLWFPMVGSNNVFTSNINFGQRPFTYTPPTGFSALNTANLSTPTIIKGNKWFDVKTRSGDANASQTTTGVAFQSDFVWTKVRNNTLSHVLFDSIRGTGKDLNSNSTGAENTNNADGYLSAFTSDGYTMTNGGVTGNLVKGNGYTYVDWLWKANGTGVSNTAGSITSTVSAGTLQGFSIVTYTGNSTNGATVGHGLGVTPRMVIIKNRTDAATNWGIYHSGLTSVNYYLQFDTSAQTNYGSSFISPSSTLLTLAGPSSVINTTAKNYVAYCFAEVAGFSKFGSYTGNGSDDGPFVWCGFRPRFILFKRTDSASDWRIHDTSRAVYNADSTALMPNLTNVEDTGSNVIDVLSNGFKCRDAGGFNVSSATYIFAAFAELPFKYANAR